MGEGFKLDVTGYSLLRFGYFEVKTGGSQLA